MNNERKKGLSRVPVVYKNKALMPMTWNRARKFIKNKTGVLVKTKNLGWYLKLKVPPSSTSTQDIVLGIDPGTKFNGYSVVSKFCHNTNFQRNTFKVNQIQKNTKLKSKFRKERRSRLRHRPIRINWRTSTKISKTSHYLIGVRLQMISDIIKIYPISHIIIEDVSFNHYLDPNKLGSSFSNIEIGKNRFRNKIFESYNINLIESPSLNTYNLRNIYFSDNKKSKDKSINTFNAHCIDSFCIANTYFNNNIKFINKSLIVINEISKNYRYSRRKLREFSAKKGRSTLTYWKPLKHYDSNNELEGINWIKLTRFHKKRLIRIKPELQKSNHGPWEYIYSFEFNSVKYPKRVYSLFHGSFDSCGNNKDYNLDTNFYDKYLTKIIIGKNGYIR